MGDVIRGLTAFSVDELRPFHKNPRAGDVGAIARSLSVNGQYRPIVVNVGTLTGRPLEVLAGNHTLAGARSLGWVTIHATTVDVDDLAAARIVAADNRTADLGSYDDEILSELLRGLPDLDGTGYDDAALAALAGIDSADMFGEESPEGYRSQFGVIITCRDERHQEEVYAAIHALGYDCKVVTV